MLKILFVASFIVFYSLAQSGKVIGVTDGDTMEMLIEGKSYKIRLAQIDMPDGKKSVKQRII